MSTDDPSCMSRAEREADLRERLKQPAYVADLDLLRYLVSIGFDADGELVHEFDVEFTLDDLLKSLAASKLVWGDGSLVLMAPMYFKDFMVDDAIFVTVVKKIQAPMPDTEENAASGPKPGWYFEGWNYEDAADLQEYVRCFVPPDFKKGYFQAIRGGPNPWPLVDWKSGPAQ